MVGISPTTEKEAPVPGEHIIPWKALMKTYLMLQDKPGKAASLLILTLGNEEWAFCSLASD